MVQQNNAYAMFLEINMNMLYMKKLEVLSEKITTDTLSTIPYAHIPLWNSCTILLLNNLTYVASLL